MERLTSIFDIFGGIRPMARHLSEPPANVSAWKRVGRIPAEKQPHVLAVGQSLGLPIAAENIVFPLGVPADQIGKGAPPVVCDHSAKTQPNASGANATASVANSGARA